MNSLRYDEGFEQDYYYDNVHAKVFLLAEVTCPPQNMFTLDILINEHYVYYFWIFFYPFAFLLGPLCLLNIDLQNF